MTQRKKVDLRDVPGFIDYGRGDWDAYARAKEAAWKAEHPEHAHWVVGWSFFLDQPVMDVGWSDYCAARPTPS